MTLRPNDGLIKLYQLYSETTTASGGYAVAGLNQYEKIQNGSDGTPILLKEYRYTQQTAGGTTIYPVAQEIAYAAEDGSHPITTSYSYTAWYPGTVQMQERVTILPAVSAEQNGPGTTATRVEQFDLLGNRTWLQDERGYITYFQYDVATGALAQQIQDVDGTQLALPSGWSTPAGGGLHLVTDHEMDDEGRVTQTLGPVHDVDGVNVRTANWFIYRDVEHEVWSGHGYATGTPSSNNYTLVNPVSISKQDPAGHELEAIQAVRDTTEGRLSVSDSFPQSAYCRWTVNFYAQQRLYWTRAYQAIPEDGEGVLGTNYAETDYGYDAMGRKNVVTVPGHTITGTVFDCRNNPIQVFVGTDDSGATDADPAGNSARVTIWCWSRKTNTTADAVAARATSPSRSSTSMP